MLKKIFKKLKYLAYRFIIVTRRFYFKNILKKPRIYFTSEKGIEAFTKDNFSKDSSYLKKYS